jgi:hypothetical protein
MKVIPENIEIVQNEEDSYTCILHLDKVKYETGGQLIFNPNESDASVVIFTYNPEESMFFIMGDSKKGLSIDSIDSQDF